MSTLNGTLVLFFNAYAFQFQLGPRVKGTARAIHMLHKGNKMRIESIKKTPMYTHRVPVSCLFSFGKQRKNLQQSSTSENKTHQKQTEQTAKGGKKDSAATVHTEKVKAQREQGCSMKYNNRKKCF